MQLSIVVPTHNRPQELKRALLSVHSQSYDQRFECIVVDDSDSDFICDTRMVTDEAGCKYLRLAPENGRGGAVARNAGIYAATGQFIAFLDDDDEWLSDKIMVQLDRLVHDGVQMSYTGLNIINKNGKSRYSYRPPHDKELRKAIMKKNFIGTTSSVIVKKESLLDVGGFDVSLPALQDYDLYLRLLSKVKITGHSDPLTIYYDHDDGSKVSGSRLRFVTAVNHLSIKYQNDPLFPYLKKSFAVITILKCIRSRRFLLDTIRDLTGCLL